MFPIGRVLFFLATLLSFISLPYECLADRLEEQLDKINKAYEDAADIKGDFVHKSRIKELKKTEIYKGSFWIKGHKIKWDYKGDKPQTVYISGNDLIIYQKREKQAIISAADKTSYGKAPMSLLTNMTHLRKEFDVSLKDDPDPERTKLWLKPKKSMGNINGILLSLKDEGFPIESITMFDPTGNKVEIFLYAVETNTSIKDSVFKFSPSDDIAIIRQ